MITAPTDLPRITVYTRPGCHLCELLLEELAPLVRDRAVLEPRDVDAREEWRQAFGVRIPVVQIAGSVVCEGRLDVPAIVGALRAASGAGHI